MACSVNTDAPAYCNLFRDGNFHGGLIAFGGPLPTGLCDIYVGSESDVFERQFYGNLSNIR
eukprot:4024394-Prorocentrum_lima.AAC.1